MSKKPRLGRNMNALLGGATRNRRDDSIERPAAIAEEKPEDSPATSSGSASSSEPSAIEESAASSASVPSHAVPEAQLTQETSDSQPSPDIAPSTPDSSPVYPSSVSGPATAPHLRAVTKPAPVPSTVPSSESSASSERQGDVLKQIGIDQIRRGAWQPRRHFDPELIQELSDSLKAQGMIQPVLVRPFSNGAYELIAGERRWRAAQLAGLQEIPALIRQMDDQRVAAVSLIENIQRKDLNPLEEAQAFERLCDEFGMTHKAVAESVGRSRASVSNLMRLLELHDEVKLLVDKSELEMGHARALLGAPVEMQPELARRIVDQGLTVRAVEKLVRELLADKPAVKDSSSSHVSDPDIDRLSRSLGDRLGTSVEIRHKASGAGRLEISYTSLTELEGILEHIK